MKKTNLKTRKTGSLLFATIAIFISGAANAAKDQCAEAVNTELALLNMGTYTQPAKSVERMDDTQMPFGNATEFRSFGQVVVVSDFLSVSRRIVVESRSIAFGGKERKEIILNQSCQIESIKLVTNSSGIEISPELCQAIETSRSTSRTGNEFEASVMNIEPKSYWSKSPFLVDIVIKQCQFYKGKFAK